MTTNRWRMFLCVAAMVFIGGLRANSTDLEASFREPPRDARPKTWWHWLDGNVTREGITADLESMQRIGLSGAYMFNCGGRGPVQKGDARFMGPKWLEMFDHTVREAERLGLTFGIHNSDGFSLSGGPWITPEMSMKILTWTAADAAGGAPFDAVLDMPATKEDFYRDIAVIAFPLPEDGPLAGATLRGTIGPRELQNLADGDESTAAAFSAAGPGGHAVEFIFDSPQTVRSLTIRNAAPHRWEEDFPLFLEASDDGTDYRRVGSFTANWDFHAGDSITAAFDETTARHFRVTFHNPIAFRIGELVLSGAAKAHFAEAKAARLRSRGHGAETRHHRAHPGPDPARPLAPEQVVPKSSVVDLSRRMDAGGRLQWTPPPGRWRILRIGYTSNGHKVVLATDEGRGLECDKLDPAAIRFHLDQYVGKLLDRSGDAAGRTFAVVEIDSWECGIQNWTAGFERRFRREVGYDLLPYMPALIEGWIVDDADATERVLWDWRRFLADQFSASFFSQARKYLNDRGIVYVGESNGRQQFLYDMAYSRNSDVTMGEFWLDKGPGGWVRVDNKLASSVAHIAGKPLVASESYTSSPGSARWQNHPYSLKAQGDLVFCAGVNQFVFHTFAHQPYEAVGPGFTFFFWGLNFNRANTWWDAGDVWIDYITRCQHLLRQGRQVCDVLWFVGEDVPNRVAWRDELNPVLPSGYDFDAADITALMEARVRDGRIILPSGAEYRVLLLPELPTMRPAAARRVLDLARAGATVVGSVRPVRSPAFRDRGAGDRSVRAAVDALWGAPSDEPVDRAVGRGRFLAGLSFKDIFGRIGLPPDFHPDIPDSDDGIIYVHRSAPGAELYFVANQTERMQSFDALFRVAGAAPELWDPATGVTTRPGVFRPTADGRTLVPLRLDPSGSIFVVFREPAAAPFAVAMELPGESTAPSRVEVPRPPENLSSASGSFTIALWVRSDTEIPLPNERAAEVAHQNQNWAVHPPQGTAVFGEGRAGVGIGAGRNGVVVFEHAARYAPAVVTAPADLSERSHVAVVYRDGAPTLYLNGKKAKAGAKGPYTPASNAGPGGPEFRGEKSPPMLFDRALTDAEIAALARADAGPSLAPPPVEIERAADGGLFARFWERAAPKVSLSTGATLEPAAPALPAAVTVAGPWTVRFPPNLGAPESAVFDSLVSWPNRPEPGIRFFSGTAVYERDIDIPKALLAAGRELYLDLGRVEVIAQVELNGAELSTLWKPPFRTRIDGIAKPGSNRIRIRVTNLWPNRMIGDAAIPETDIEWGWTRRDGSSLPAAWPDWLIRGQPRPSGRISFCMRKDVYAADSPLLPSGLIGPVRLVPAVVAPLKGP